MWCRCWIGRRWFSGCPLRHTAKPTLCTTPGGGNTTIASLRHDGQALLPISPRAVHRGRGGTPAQPMLRAWQKAGASARAGIASGVA